MSNNLLNLKRKRKRLMLTLLVAPSLAFMASATDNVTIEPVISNGVAKGSGNAAPNVWFTIDDSGSMGSMGTGVYSGTEGYKGRLTHGYIAYDPDLPYENYIPVDHLGNLLPLPSNVNRTYKLGPSQGQTSEKASGGTSIDCKNLYSDIFITYARENMDFIADNNNSYQCGTKSGKKFKKYASSTWSTVASHPTIEIAKTAQITEESYLGKYYYSKVKNDTSCRSASNKKRCQVWKTYYSSKMLALKSGLSLALYKHRNTAYRFGFQGFWRQDSSAWSFDDWTIANINDDKIASTRWGIFGSATDRIDERVSLFPVKTNTDENRKALYRWLFTLIPESGTPTRVVQSYLFHQLRLPQYGGSSTGSIYLEDPTKAYDEDDNPALTCRQNHNIVFTDGQWETSYADGTEAAIKAKMGNYTQATTESSSITLPDSKIYSARAPFKATPKIFDVNDNNNSSTEGVRQLADLAFQGWITDLDGDTSNNKTGDDGALLIDYKKYKDTNNNEKLYKNDGDEYWHPFNDPAAWQHVNTHAVGFGLDTSKYGDISVNPPQTKAEALTLDNTWGLNTVISNSKQWERSTWADDATIVMYNYKPPQPASFMTPALSEGDLARTAIVGRGLFYNAKSGEDVLNAFDRIMDKIRSGGEFISANSGASGTAGGSQNLDNNYYSTRYDVDSFTGELIKRPLYSGTKDTTKLGQCFNTYDINNLPVRGTPCDKGGWNAAERVTAQATRHIITGKRADQTSAHANYTLVDFDIDELSTTQKTKLINNFPVQLSGNFGNNTNRLEKLMAYIKGSADEEKSGSQSKLFRSRIHTFADNSKKRNILGSMMRSSPVFVGIPSAYISHFGKNDNELTNYTTYVKDFISKNKSGDKEVLYIGANDGMLHAFKANTGEEIFAYLPNLIYDKLPKTVTPGEQLSLVDGNIDVQSVYFSDKKWYRALVSSLGGGAKGLFALDVTTTSGTGTPTATSVKQSQKINWEYGKLESKLFNKGKSNVGNIMAKPAMIQLHDDTWVAITGNGYNSESNKPAVIIVDLETGEAIQELVLPTTDASKPNGLGPLYFVSYPGKAKTDSNKYDRAYAGDLQGNLWVFDLQGSSKTKGIKVIEQSGNPKPLFTATDDDGKAQPITVFPRAVVHPKGYGYLVHFGTGSLFATEDLSSKVDNSIYAIWDDWVTDSKIGLPDSGYRTSTVQKAQLNNIVLKDTKQGSSTIRYIDNASKTNWWLQGAMTSKHRGWKIDLQEGERAWQPSYIAYGDKNSEAIAYNTVKYVGDDETTGCSTEGQSVQSWQLAFNIKDATQKLASSGVLDVNGDHTVNQADKVTLTTGGTAQAVTGLAKTNVLIFNSTTQRIQEFESDNPGGGNSGGGGTGSNAAQRNVCHFTAQVSADSTGGITPTTVRRCSYFSSWSELK